MTPESKSMFMADTLSHAFLLIPAAARPPEDNLKYVHMIKLFLEPTTN